MGKHDPQTYDTSKGFGNPEQWKQAFKACLTDAEINGILKGRSPQSILNMPDNASIESLKSKYRQLCIQFHPDKNPNGTEQFQLIQAAWQRINK